MSLFKGSFWKKLPGILQRIAELILVAGHGAGASIAAAAPVASFDFEKLRPSLAKLPAFLLAMLGAARLVGQFTGKFHVPPGAEGGLQAVFDATTNAVHSVLVAWQSLMDFFALFGGLAIIGVRQALPGGKPLTGGKGITIETFGTVSDGGPMLGNVDPETLASMVAQKIKELGPHAPV